MENAHICTLYNIRGFDTCTKRRTNSKILSMLEEGVLGGKQFPFRYLVRYESILNSKKKFKKKTIIKNIIKKVFEKLI